MKMNIHPIEQMIRIILGIFLISMAFWGPENTWFLLGVIPLLTGMIGWCPVYSILGLSTLKHKTVSRPKIYHGKFRSTRQFKH